MYETNDHQPGGGRRQRKRGNREILRTASAAAGTSKKRGRISSVDESAVDHILLIKRAQDVGFTLNEIKQLLTLLSRHDELPAQEMRLFAEEKIRSIKEQINRLERFRLLLEQAITLPSSPVRKESCPVLRISSFLTIIKAPAAYCLGLKISVYSCRSAIADFFLLFPL